LGSAPHHRPTNYTFLLLFEADNAPLQAPGVEVPAGCSVYVRGINGTATGNAQVAYVGPTFESVQSPLHRTNLLPNTQVPYPVANLREIWAMGKANDGVQIQVIGS
jgi:hypothetical protein